MSEIPPPPNIFIVPKSETPIKGVIIYSIILLVAIIGLANLYSYLNIYLPLITIRTILPFGYSLLIGYFMTWGIYLGKIKGMGNVVLLGFIGSIISVYLFWVIWTGTMLGESMLSRIGSLFQGMSELNVEGIYIKGEMVGGTTALKALWVIETILVFFVPIFVINDLPPKFSSLFSNN